MTCSPLQLIANNANALRDAVTAASSVRASKAFGTRAITRKGNGRAVVVGEYTGMDDAMLDIEIIAGGGTPRASVPTFSGVGSGELLISGVTPSVVQEELTLTLVDMGTITAAASLVVGSVVLRDKTPGASGNAINVSVTPALTKTAAPMATLEAWPTSTALQSSGAWAGLGGLPLSASGEINPATPRLIFGNDVTVYRPYTTIENGTLKYGLSPAVERDIPEGAQVYTVAGGYTITVTEGATVENYSAESFYEWLTAMATSGLIEVAGVIIADRTPGGMAAIDVPLRTTAFISSFEGIKLNNVSAAPSAPTERVTIECTNNTRVGGELWQVSGTASGELGVATTGQPFTSDSVLFTVPMIAQDTLPKDAVGTKYTPTSRTEGEGVPGVCFNPIALGVAATRGSVTWTYKQRPPADCPCEGQSAGIISNKCLGLPGEEFDNMNPEFVSRLKAVYAWRETAVRANTAYYAGQSATPPVKNCTTTPGTPGTPDYYYFTASIHLDYGRSFTLRSSQFTTPALAESARASSSNPVVASGICIVGQSVQVTTGAGTISMTVDFADYAVVGTDISGESLTLSAGVFTEDGGSSTPGSTTCVTVSPGTPAICATFKAAVVDLNWIESSIGVIVPCLNEIIETPTAITMWDSLWVEVQADLTHLLATTDDDVCTPNPRYLDRYRATCDNIKLEAGILPKYDAGPDGDGCWQDNGDAFWWEDNNGVYAPVFSNTVYYSSKKGEDGGYYSTQEFAFGLVVSCPERLKEGDQVTFSIDSTDGVKPYQIGDKATLTVYGGAPAFLTGGVHGSDTQTWALSGSVSGGLADYMLPAAGSSYIGTGFNLMLTPGGIQFELGDSFKWTFEAGQWWWRKNAGTWSAAADIPISAPAVLIDGLSLAFYPAAAPSFVAGDAYRCTIMQPYAPRHAQAPTRDYAWEWIGASAELVLQLSAPTTISTLAAGLLDLPTGATLTMSVSTDGGTTYTHYSMPGGFAASVQLATPVLATHIKASVSNAAGGRIGWLWAGVPFTTEYAAKLTRIPTWAMTRGASLNPSGLMAGYGRGSEAVFDAMNNAEAELLIAMIDHMQHNDEPLIVATVDKTDVCRVDFSQLQLTDVFEFQTIDINRRLITATLPLTAWLS